MMMTTAVLMKRKRKRKRKRRRGGEGWAQLVEHL